MTMQVIGLALVHSLWEGGIIAALVALAFSLTRKSSASLRYLIGMIGLAAMIVLPVATVARSNTDSRSSAVSAAAPSVEFPDASVTPDAVSAAASPGSISITPDVVSAESLSPNPPASFLTKLEPSLPWLVIAWLIGLLVLSARMISGVARTRRIVRDGHEPSSEQLRNAVAGIASTLNITRAIRALEGAHVTVPMVVGWIRPVLVVPISLVTGLTPAQLDMLVAHELAHIRRYDYLANLAQTVIETLLFFHPGVWWLSERIREERENCCDDIALAVCGNDRKAYTAVLLALEESRDDDFVFAAAATGHGDGGSLLRRAMRLLSGGPAHLDLGARWIAGVITIFAALFTTGPAVGKAADLPIASKLDVVGMLTSQQDTVEHGKYASDATRSDPDTVLIYGGSASFSERWRWAVDRAGSLRSNRYWIGYLVAGDPTSQMIYQDSDVPVRSGGSTFRGRMRIGDATNLIFTGSQLSPIFGMHSYRSTAIFLQFERSSGRLTRVHLGSYGLPVYFDRTPAIWIDSASDAESVAKLRALAMSERSIEKRRDLISMISMHRDVTASLPPLVELVDSRSESESIRKEAVEGIGEISDPRALAVLSRVARTDRSIEVRKEAIEAFENMRLSAAGDTLMAFATSLEDSRLRHVAIEALGSQHDERTAAFLKRLATSSNDYNARKEAVEALGEMHEIGFSALADLARNTRDVGVRKEAVEALADAESTDRALDLLLEIVRNDSDRSVKLEAVEAIGEIHNSRANGVLLDLVRRSADLGVQIKATEVLGQAVNSDGDVRTLASLAQNHPQSEVRRKAIETLGDVNDDQSAGPALISIARSDGDPEMRRRAIESLGNIETSGARDALRAIATSDGSERLRRQAMETYTENVAPDVAISFLKSVIVNDRNESIRLNALEMLAELDDDAGIPAVRELARSSQDERIRRRAVNLLDDR